MKKEYFYSSTCETGSQGNKLYMVLSTSDLKLKVDIEIVKSGLSLSRAHKMVKELNKIQG